MLVTAASYSGLPTGFTPTGNAGVMLPGTIVISSNSFVVDKNLQYHSEKSSDRRVLFYGDVLSMYSS